MRNANQIAFKDLMNLGFKKEIHSDSVFEDDYGVPYMITQLEITPYTFDWCQRTQIVRLLKCDNTGTIILEKDMESFEELCFFIELLKPLK